MKSFQELYTEVQDVAGDDSSALLTQIKRWINDTQDLVLAAHPWKFLETTRDFTTTASMTRIELSNDLRKLITVKSTPDSGTTYYNMTIVEDPDFWELLQQQNAGSSEQPEYCYLEGNDLLIWPTYATASDTITVRYRRQATQMSLDDYMTGTITTLTSGGTGVVGSGTSWNGRKPVGNQYIRVDYTTGDFAWYRIATITDDTNIVLEKKYLGATLGSGSETYTLGEFPIMPSNFHPLCFYRPLALAYMKLENTSMSDRYWKMYDGGLEAGAVSRPGGLLGRMIKEQSGATDSAYYPPIGHDRGFSSPEQRSLNHVEGESW